MTHWKAGSTWVDRILRRCAPERIVAPLPERAQFLGSPIKRGRIYPRVYVTREEFERVRVPGPWRRFVVIRDLRDTLVSAYFSVRSSHPVGAFPDLARDRAELRRMSSEEGLGWMMGQRMVTGSAAIQWSWVSAGEPVVRYERLLEDDAGMLEQVLVERCGLSTDRPTVRRAVEGARFSAVTGGRRPGEEDETAHQRKGVAGDWRNHFSDSLKDHFKRRFGNLLIATGYEADLDW